MTLPRYTVRQISRTSTFDWTRYLHKYVSAHLTWSRVRKKNVNIFIHYRMNVLLSLFWHFIYLFFDSLLLFDTFSKLGGSFLQRYGTAALFLLVLFYPKANIRHAHVRYNSSIQPSLQVLHRMDLFIECNDRELVRSCRVKLKFSIRRYRSRVSFYSSRECIYHRSRWIQKIPQCNSFCGPV